MLCAQFHIKLGVFAARKYESTLNFQPRRPLPVGVYDLVFYTHAASLHNWTPCPVVVNSICVMPVTRDPLK